MCPLMKTILLGQPCNWHMSCFKGPWDLVLFYLLFCLTLQWKYAVPFFNGFYGGGGDAHFIMANCFRLHKGRKSHFIQPSAIGPPESGPPTWPLPLDPTLIKLRDDKAVAYPKGWAEGHANLPYIRGKLFRVRVTNWQIYSGEIIPSRGGGGHANWQIYSGEIIPSRGSLSSSGNRCLME